MKQEYGPAISASAGEAPSDGQILAHVNDLLRGKGLTKNESGERDPAMKQSKRGNQWHFIDKVAYVRLASVYRSFEDVDEFRQLIRDI